MNEIILLYISSAMSECYIKKYSTLYTVDKTPLYVYGKYNRRGMYQEAMQHELKRSALIASRHPPSAAFVHTR